MITNQWVVSLRCVIIHDPSCWFMLMSILEGCPHPLVYFWPPSVQYTNRVLNTYFEWIWSTLILHLSCLKTERDCSKFDIPWKLNLLLLHEGTLTYVTKNMHLVMVHVIPPNSIDPRTCIETKLGLLWMSLSLTTVREDTSMICINVNIACRRFI